MIRIHVLKEHSEVRLLKITGHAESAPYGQDLVCAGVSAIALSSLNAIDRLYPGSCRLKAQGNLVEIRVAESSCSLQQALSFLVEQLQCMEEANPSFIRMHIRSEFSVKEEKEV